jgi:hypothetical protein
MSTTSSTPAPTTPTGTAPSKFGGWALAAKLAAYEAAAGVLYTFALNVQWMDFALPFVRILFLLPLVAWALEAFPNRYTEKGVKVLVQLFVVGAVLAAAPLFLNQVHHMFWTVDNDLGDTMDKTKSGLALKLSTQIEQEMVGPGLELMKQKNVVEGEITNKLRTEYQTALATWHNGGSDEEFIKSAKDVQKRYQTLRQAQTDLTNTIGGDSGTNKGSKIAELFSKGKSPAVILITLLLTLGVVVLLTATLKG